ncbi:hypothetical protein [Alsobacter metallidurans]|nr:hypothetical protein [Alsobacter metallidurans]
MRIAHGFREQPLRAWAHSQAGHRTAITRLAALSAAGLAAFLAVLLTR